MKKGFSTLGIFLLLVLAGCSGFDFIASQNTGQGFPITTAPVLPLSANAPDASLVARAYLDAWKNGDYPAMYALLTSISQSAISADEFSKHYDSISIEAVLENIDYEMLSVLVNPDSAQVSYRVKLKSMLAGEFSRDTVMNLSLEKNQWRVQWDDTLVLPELKGGNYLYLDRGDYVPSRANIYDRLGRAIVAQADATAIGLYPDQVDPAKADTLFAALSELTGLQAGTIRSLYESAPAGAGWYIPLGELATSVAASKISLLSGMEGVALRPYKARYYFDKGVAPHVVGYVSSIQPEEVDAYKRLGYQPDERVGRIGLEKWGETYLAGGRGGALYVMNAQGQPLTLLARATPQPSQAIYTTLDKDFQLAARQALSNFRGAVVVLERDTGRVLAMVSSPGFDPNAFEPVNFNSSQSLFEITSDPNQPLLNRASQGLYPLGSVFKTITMAAALESGRYSADSTYQCGYFFDELPGARLHDWTYDYFVNDGRTIPSGLLTLPQGLIRSCNPYFWHIGLDLYNQGMTDAVSRMARGFGLGQLTRILGVEEESGRIPDPASAVDAVNMAIGQGDVLVTPLQVANFMAAVGNGGTLYRPQVVEKVAPPDGKVSYQFRADVIGKLPLKPENLQLIQQALIGVVRNEKPRGTAWHRFTGLDVAVAGKTGTAQTASGRPHAWFAGYTFAERQDKPDIAIAVIVENAGEGSDYAAPIFRRIVELYFSGQPQKLYWWESQFNVPLTGTPDPLATPGLPWLGTPALPLVATPRP